MGLQDFASVFSRSFVVGFFVPAFVAAFAVDQIANELMPASFRAASTGTQALVLGGIGLVVGILLSGLNYPILRLFEGYPLTHSKDFGRLRNARRRKWREKFDALQAILDEDEQPTRRTHAASKLNDFFPVSRETVLPTGFGNAVRAFETHPRDRYGLDGVAVWPRIEMLLDETQRRGLEDLRANVAFFVNGCIAIVITAVLLVVHALAHTSDVELALRVAASVVGGALLYAFFYWYAIQSAVNWGSGIRSAVDLRRFELFRALGLKAPTTEAEEKTLGRFINRELLYAEPFPDEWRQPLDPPGGP